MIRRQNKSPDIIDQIGSSQIMTSKKEPDTINSEEAQDLIYQNSLVRIKIESDTDHIHSDMIVEEHVLSPDFLNQTSTYYPDINESENGPQSSPFTSLANISNNDQNNNNTNMSMIIEMSQDSQNDDDNMISHLQSKLSTALNLKSSVHISIEEVQSLFKLLDQNSTDKNEIKENEKEGSSKSNKSKKTKQNKSSKEEDSRIKKLQSQVSNFKKQIATLTSTKSELERQINEERAKIWIFADGFRDLNSKLQQQTSLVEKMEQCQIRDLPTKTLSHIFDYLDFESLKQSRFVCRSWRFQAGKIMLEKHSLVADSSSIGKCLNSLKFWINSTFTPRENLPSPMWKLCVNNDSVGLYLLQNIPILRLCIRKLKYHVVVAVEEGTLPQNQTSENLFHILKLLPNLEILQTHQLNLSYNQPWIGYFVNGVPINVQLFLQQLERLKSIQLNYFLGPYKQPIEILRHNASFMTNIKEIKTRGMNFVTLFLNMKVLWPIEKLTLKLTTINVQDIGLIRQFMGRIYTSLKHLKIIIGYSRAVDFNCENFSYIPWTCDWIIPDFLNKLETLEISIEMNPIPNLNPISIPILNAIEPSGTSEACQSSSSPFELDPFLIKSIISALRLPHLKTLAIDHIPWNLEGIVHNWNTSEIGNGQKLKSWSLENLELLSEYSPSSLSTKLHHCKIPGTIWPALKSLKFPWNWNPDENTLSQNFLSELNNLQKIEMVTKTGSIFKYKRRE